MDVSALLTFRRKTTGHDRSSSAVYVVKRMRTPCATYILARTIYNIRPIRPRRDLQSDPRLSRNAPLPPRSRAPPITAFDQPRRALDGELRREMARHQ